MKRKFALGLSSILVVTTLFFAGCSNGGNRANNLKEVNNKQQTSSTSVTGNTTAKLKDAKDITDKDLLNSANEDSSAQLDSAGVQSQQLSPDEIDTLLNDNSDLDNIPTNFSVK